MIDGTDAQALLREGLQALHGGRPQDAHDLLTRALAANAQGAEPYLLAQACRLLGDEAGEKQALDQQLRLKPRHLPALLLMAEHQVRAGDDRAATSFYRTALAAAEHDRNAGSPVLAAMLNRGRLFLQQAEQRFTEHLGTIVASVEDGRAGSRMRQAIDLLLGRTQLYLQQPSMFYFPGLPQRQYYERDEFAWVAILEAAAPAIRAEAVAALGDDTAFPPYIEHNPDRPRPPNHLLGDASWGAFHLWRSGAVVPDNAARCPHTMAALEHAPIPVIAGRSPSAMFSRLKPGTHIKPHFGMLNTRLICHLPLIVPPDCALRVGNETRAWCEGELLIFDDSFEHEAWNRSTQDRVVLLFEIWRPELSADERASLTQIYETIGAYGEH